MIMIRLIILVIVLLYVNCGSSSVHEDEVMILLYDEMHDSSDSDSSSHRRLLE